MMLLAIRLRNHDPSGRAGTKGREAAGAVDSRFEHARNMELLEPNRIYVPTGRFRNTLRLSTFWRGDFFGARPDGSDRNRSKREKTGVLCGLTLNGVKGDQVNRRPQDSGVFDDCIRCSALLLPFHLFA